MKMTREEDYAIILMLILAEAYSQKLPVSLQRVALDRSLPYPFLKKIVGSLKEANLIVAREGSAGGYRLALPPSQINLREILEAIRGPEAIIEHDLGLYDCLDARASAKKKMVEIGQEVRQLLANTRLTDIIS